MTEFEQAHETARIAIAREQRALHLAKRRALLRALVNFVTMVTACFMVLFAYFVVAFI
jgi:hypothetical protein